MKRINLYLASLLLTILLIPGLIFGQEVLKTPNSEVEDAIKYLVGEQNGVKYVDPIDYPYIRFLSTYSIKDDQLKRDAALAGSFVLHSLVGPAKDLNSNNAGAFYPLAKMEEIDGVRHYVEYKRVPFSNTLWWIDLRDYNFTPEAWEKAASIDGYFVTPIVQEQNNGALRLTSGGNSILRMDWFISQVTDTARQLDNDLQFDLYNTFLFAKVTPPKNVDEWRKLFNLDINKSRDIGNEAGVLVTKSKVVSRDNRVLFGYNTELGYLYDTYDVKNQQGKRDYLESFFKNKIIGTPPDVSDAGEIFGTNQLGLQVYALRDGQGKLINFGDPTVVRHLTDVFGDARVRVAHSCIDCHAAGPIPAENSLKEYVGGEYDLYFKNKEDRNRVKRVFLDNKFEDSIETNKKAFARAVEKSNGCTPEETGKKYLDVIRNYNSEIDVDRAAFECGVTKEEFIAKIGENRFGGRIKKLVKDGETIPIDVWETRGQDGIPGGFQQAMIMINGLTAITNEYKVEEPIKEPKVEEFKYFTNEDVGLMSGPTKIGIVPKDTKINILEIRGDFGQIEYGGKKGWVDLRKIRKE